MRLKSEQNTRVGQLTPQQLGSWKNSLAMISPTLQGNLSSNNLCIFKSLVQDLKSQMWGVFLIGEPKSSAQSLAGLGQEQVRSASLDLPDERGPPL